MQSQMQPTAEEIDDVSDMCANICRGSHNMLLSVAQFVSTVATLKQWDKETCNQVGTRALTVLYADDAQQ